MPLDYASPLDRRPADDVAWLAAIGVRLVFVLGFILLCYGLGLALRNKPDAEGFMGWGGALVGLTVPFGPAWRPRRSGS